MVPITPRLTTTVYAVSRYDSVISGLVRAKAWRNMAAARQLGMLILHKYHHVVESYDMIVPVPQHITRYAWLGYNQATIMARVLSDATGVPLFSLRRTRRTVLQKNVSGAKRMQNVKDAFGVPFFSSESEVRAAFKGKRVLLVDDVYTTGATLQSLARFCARMRPASVDAMVACRVIPQ